VRDLRDVWQIPGVSGGKKPGKKPGKNQVIIGKHGRKHVEYIGNIGDQ